VGLLMIAFSSPQLRFLRLPGQRSPGWFYSDPLFSSPCLS